MVPLVATTMRKPVKIRRRFSEDNEVSLFAGDCLRLLSQIPSSTIQLVITSPPYNIGKPYEKRQGLDSYLEQQRTVIGECVRVLRPGGSICWQVGNHANGHGQTIPLDLLLFPLFSEFEKTERLRLRNRIVWHFQHGLHCRHRFSGRYETILWYSKADNYTFNLDAVRIPQIYPGKRAYKGPNRGEYSGHPLGKNPGDVWIFPNVKSNHIEKTKHPCQFPVELPARLIRALSDPGDIVLDPFIGSGTTAVAAVALGRRVAGAEIVREYVEMARARINKAARGLLPFRPADAPVYVPRPGTRLTTLPSHFRRVS
jgi:adenine-specific DNA-methyltransferase